MNLTPPLSPAVLEQAFTLYRLSRMLFAVANLDLASHLRAGARDAEELAVLTSTHAPTLRSMLDALACWGAFSRDENGRYGLTPFSERLLAEREGAAPIAMLLGWAGLPAAYEAFGELMHTLRTGQAALRGRHGTGFHGYLAQHPEDAELYARAMESTTDSFRHGADAYDFGAARSLVDVGGGEGAFAVAILARYPQLSAVSYDLPDVIAKARPIDHPASGRLQLVPGDAMASVPPGADIYMTSTVLRCFDDAACARLLENIRAAMGPGSRLVCYEMVVSPGRDVLMHCMGDFVARVLYGGQDRSESEFVALLEQAGLRHTRTIPLEGTACIIEAVRSER